jgi:hypothetical protein
VLLQLLLAADALVVVFPNETAPLVAGAVSVSKVKGKIG